MAAPLRPSAAAKATAPCARGRALRKTEARPRVGRLPAKRTSDAASTVEEAAQDAGELGDVPLAPEVRQAMSALLAFGLVAADVEGERSLHVLLPYDQAMFAYAASLPTDAILYARTVVSDTPIEAALYAWAGALAVGTLRPGARRRVWEASFFAFVGALVLMGPPPLGIVSFLKDAFERPRPEAVLSSYAFPSGHTAAACYGWGVLFLSLLPSAVPESLRLLRTPDGDAPSPTAFALWSLPVVCTAGGRVVGEAHWLSDTIAGACVAASTALLASGAARWAKQTRERAQ